MKLLLDSCVSGIAASELRDAGQDVLYAGEWDEDPATTKSWQELIQSVESSSHLTKISVNWRLFAEHLTRELSVSSI